MELDATCINKSIEMYVPYSNGQNFDKRQSLATDSIDIWLTQFECYIILVHNLYQKYSLSFQIDQGSADNRLVYN